MTERKAVEFEKQKRRFSPIFSPHLSSARNSVRLVPPATTRLCQGHGTWGCRRTKLLSIIIPIWQLFLGWDLVLFLWSSCVCCEYSARFDSFKFLLVFGLLLVCVCILVLFVGFITWFWLSVSGLSLYRLHPIRYDPNSSQGFLDLPCLWTVVISAPARKARKRVRATSCANWMPCLRLGL